MIEQDFNYSDPTIKEMTDIFETRVENSELKEEKKKNLPMLPGNKTRSPPRKEKHQTPTQVL